LSIAGLSKFTTAALGRIFMKSDFTIWLLDTPEPPAPRLLQYTSLVEDQQRLGWIQLHFGRWRKLRATHRTSFIQSRSINPTSTIQRTGWSSRVKSLILNHCYKACIDRNQAVHVHTLPTKSFARQYRVSFDFLLNMISETNAPISCVHSGLTHHWMSIFLEKQIQSSFKTGLR
jgi:hypothetical protein